MGNNTAILDEKLKARGRNKLKQANEEVNDFIASIDNLKDQNEEIIEQIEELQAYQ